MPQTELTHLQLINQLSLGDEGAFKKIYDLYWNKLYLSAFNKIRSSENAQEIVQDIFLDLWDRRGNVKINDLEVYLFSAVKYQVFDYIKKEIVRKKYTDSVRNLDYDNTNTPENKFIYNELQRSVLNAIETLPNKTRAIIQLNRLHYKSADEISKEIGIPTRTVEYHITLGLKALKLHLKDFLLIIIYFFSAW